MIILFVARLWRACAPNFRSCLICHRKGSWLHRIMKSIINFAKTSKSIIPNPSSTTFQTFWLEGFRGEWKWDQAEKNTPPRMIFSPVSWMEPVFRNISRANGLLATAFQAHSGERLRCRFKIVNISFYPNIRPLLTNHCKTKPEPNFMRLRQTGCYVFADLGEGVPYVCGSASMTEWLFSRKMPWWWDRHSSRNTDVTHFWTNFPSFWHVIHN